MNHALVRTARTENGPQTSLPASSSEVSDSFPAPSISEYWVLRSFDSRLAGPSLVRTQAAVRRNHCSITLSRRTSTVREGRGLRPGRAPPAMARRRAMLCTALVAGVGGAAGFTIPLHQLRVKVGREARTGSRSLALTARVVQVGGSEMNVAGADEDVYYVTVNVGTPPQPFRVKLDTSTFRPCCRRERPPSLTSHCQARTIWCSPPA